MAKKREQIYRRKRPMRTLLCTLGIVIVALALLLIVVFFWFQSYIVHTTDGIRLDVPFLRGITAEIPAASIIQTPEPTETAPPTPIGPAEVWPAAPIAPDYIRGVWIAPGQVAAIPDLSLTLEGFAANTVLFPMTAADGMLWWDSEVELARSYMLQGLGNPSAFLDEFEQNVTAAAVLHAFQNGYMAERNLPATRAEGWLDPQNEEIQRYLTDLVLELAALGFDEVILTALLPPTALREEGDQAAIYAFLTQLAAQFGREGMRLGILTTEATWRALYADTVDGLDYRELLDVIDRFYLELSDETLADRARFDELEAELGVLLGEVGMRKLIPLGGANHFSENWITRS